MRLPYLLRLAIDEFLGFHGDCICQYADFVDWENGVVTSLYIAGVKFVPETQWLEQKLS